MPKYQVVDINKKSVGSIELDPSVFEAEIKEHLFYYVVNWQRAKKRAGTASTKTRGEVRGGSRKPWRQKGTGNARAGTRSSPIWRGGGIVFGPKPKDWSYSLPKKVRRNALLSALSLKHRDGKINILNNLELPGIKTKQVAEFLNLFGLNKTLIVISDENENFTKSARNLNKVKVLNSDGLNVYDILKFDSLVFTERSVQKIQEVLKR
ncbi:MAG: 50S ribosomal protein L4 [Candidatus Dadabacteria bacterium]|nr:50S ribosomal protein L4 [Candidatus Dadabacteria bacterium]